MSRYVEYQRRAPLSCLLCGRVLAEARWPLRETPLTATVHVERPEHAEYVRRWRCATCGGRLTMEAAVDVAVLLPLPRWEVDTRLKQPAAPVQPRPPCAECEIVPAGSDSRYCGACKSRRWRQKARAET